MNYCIRYHPLVARDLDIIAQWILDYAGPDAATRKLGEIESASCDPPFRSVGLCDARPYRTSSAAGTTQAAITPQAK